MVRTKDGTLLFDERSLEDSDFKDKAIHLQPRFTWILGVDCDGEPILVPIINCTSKERKKNVVSKIKKVEKCWLWTGSIGEKGYGIYRGKGAHVVVYEFYKGNVPKGLELDHLCRVTNCVNPEHLEAVTHKENCLRGVGVTAKNAKKEQCANGHALSGSNIKIVIRKDGTRRKCRKCHYLYEQKRREKINAK